MTSEYVKTFLSMFCIFYKSNTVLSQLADKLHSELERRISVMDNEFNKEENLNENFVMYNPESEIKEETEETVKEEQETSQETSSNQPTSENVTYRYSYVNPTPLEKPKKKRKHS